MNAEERAQKIVDEFYREWDSTRKTAYACVPIIAKAIKQAEQAAKLEGIKQHFNECEKREQAAFEEGRKEGLKLKRDSYQDWKQAYEDGQREMRERAENKVCGLDHCDMSGHSCTKEIEEAIRALPLTPHGGEDK